MVFRREGGMCPPAACVVTRRCAHAFSTVGGRLGLGLWLGLGLRAGTGAETGVEAGAEAETNGRDEVVGAITD